MFSKIASTLKPNTIAVAIGLSFFVCGTASTQATPIIGAEIFVQNTGHVFATFVGSDANFDNLISLVSPNNSGSLFEGHVTPPGTTIDLGMFAAGTELVFQTG